jgi:N-alpha-acetyltransferase 50
MTSTTSSKKTLSSKVTFASLTQNNLGTVRKLNSVLFPIKYSEKFYSEILLPEVDDFCKLSTYFFSFFPPVCRSNPTVYYNDIPVGTICCRLEPKDKVSHLYLLTMGVLAVRHGYNSTPLL